MLKIGARAHDYGKKAPRELFEHIRSDGYEGIQLAFKKAVAGIACRQDITPEVLEETRSALKDTGLALPVLGTYVELAAADERQRAEAVEEFSAGIAFARELKAGCIGTETTKMSSQPQITQGEVILLLKRSLEVLLPQAEAAGVIVAVEPVWGHTLHTWQDAVELLKDMRSENLQIIFDPVNLLDPADAGRQAPYFEKCFEALREHIVAVHMKGTRIADGQKQSVRFWDSILDYETVFRLLRQMEGELFVLHEEADPATADRAMKFLKPLL